MTLSVEGGLQRFEPTADTSPFPYTLKFPLDLEI
jgi:hypothetical protein